MSTAHIEGSLWGARARDYAELVEGMFWPAYEAVFAAAGVGPGTSLLDVGCGPGLAAHLAARRGATVAGLDAAEASVAVARERTPTGDFRVGEMEELPWSGGVFDVVTGFNAFQFAADPIKALREAGRVARPGGRVAMLVWGREDEIDVGTIVAALGPFLPPRPPSANPPRPLTEPAHVAALLEETGLTPFVGGEVDCPYEAADLATAVRAMLSAGPMVAACRQAGDDVVRRCLSRALLPFRTGASRYLLQNRLVYAVATI